MSETPSTDRSRITAALTRFNEAPLADAARELFRTLGYGSERFQTYGSADAFLEFYDREEKVRKLLGKTARKSNALLQQLTSEDIASNSSGQLTLMDAAGLDTRLANSYLFLALPLAEEDPTRARLAEITRAINGLFLQPLLVLYQHGDQISLALTYRRRNKRDASKDVIERKVTLIMGVSTTTPHPGHASILRDFALTSVAKALKRDVNTFDDLDEAWRTSLSTQLLNERFYLDIANWYFHAREHAKFPKDAPLDPDGKPSLPIIRLLTRVVFCWFLKEKHLIPDALFDPEEVRKLLKDASPTGHSYYTAILQNLFFATLNTEMDGGESKRRFIENADKKHSDDHMVHHLWRHAGQLANVKAFEELMRPIPFLNGGLFECLDDRVKQGKSPHTREVRVDGFSEDPAKQPKLPNFLFFGEAHEEDLSDVYGDKRRKKEAVYPLLTILRRYKFTLTENTPIEEEVALDPELLGHVFENLLAAYNPETGTVARKATGSFYTPRVVVDWMVDQALLVHLRKQLPDALRPTEDDLKRLVSWDEGPELSPKQCEAIVQVVNSLRSIDPACGSGAFLMGLLQKLVHVLQKVDPQNKRWRQLQVKAADAIPSATGREAAQRAIERAFQQDNDDYGRKLYLIENGIYGVDIQPIAVQIAKLRFFISLIVDQRIRYERPQENYGILSLPNLETQIVAADSLMGMENVQLAAASDQAIELAGELRQVRHQYFTARRYSDKKALRKRDEDLREALREEMEENGFGGADAQRLAHWNPYDTNRHAPFFSPVWMFGIEPADRGNAEGVFDIVISNPPYVRQETLKHLNALDSKGVERPLKDVLEERYACYTSMADLYIYFYERSFQLLKEGGVLSTITNHGFLRTGYGGPLRNYLVMCSHLHTALDFGDAPVFTAIAYPIILVAEKTRTFGTTAVPKELNSQQLPSPEVVVKAWNWQEGLPINEFPDLFEQNHYPVQQRALRSDGWQLEDEEAIRLLKRLEACGEPLGTYCKGRIYRGILTGLNRAFVVNRETRDQLIAEHASSKEILKPYLRGRDAKRWRTTPEDWWLITIPSSENVRHPWSQKGDRVLSESQAEPVFKQTYPAIARFMLQYRDKLKARSDQGRYFWELRSCSYWGAFDEPKIVIPAITGTVNYAPDKDGYICNNKATIIVPADVNYVLAICNSRVNLWFAKRRFNPKQGGFNDYEPRYSSQTPVPPATDKQRKLIERLVSAIVASYARDKESQPLPWADLRQLWERWINGLVYELYFPEDLHAAGITLFDITQRILDGAATEPKEVTKRFAYWQQLLKEVEGDGPLAQALAKLHELEVVRRIEGVGDVVAEVEPVEEED
jgi:adenine-specific DNA-methyltransferase